MSSKWSFGLVECSFVNLAEKILNKDQYFCDQCPKMMGKNFWQKIFQHKLVYLTNRKQYWQRDRQTSVEMTGKCCSMTDDEKEEKLCQKNSAKHPPGHVVSSCDKPSDCFSTKKKPMILCSCLEEHEKNTNKNFVKTKLCPQIDPPDS